MFFEKPLDAAFLKINTLTLGRFLAFFLFFFFFLQGWHSPSGYNHVRPSKFKSNKPSHKGLHKGVAMLVFHRLQTVGLSLKTTADERENARRANLCAARRWQAALIWTNKQVKTTLVPKRGQFQPAVQASCLRGSLITSVCMKELSGEVKIFVTDLMNLHKHTISAVRLY